MSDTAQCSKCGYKIELPHADLIQIFYKDHNCDSTKLQEAIQRVRELHKPASDGRCLGCDDRCSCFEGDLGERNKWVTCPTIQALDGEQ